MSEAKKIKPRMISRYFPSRELANTFVHEAVTNCGEVSQFEPRYVEYYEQILEMLKGLELDFVEEEDKDALGEVLEALIAECEIAHKNCGKFLWELVKYHDISFDPPDGLKQSAKELHKIVVDYFARNLDLQSLG